MVTRDGRRMDSGYGGMLTNSFELNFIPCVYSILDIMSAASVRTCHTYIKKEGRSLIRTAGTTKPLVYK